MRAKLIFTSCFILCSILLSAQTKIIAHKSHSGSDADFYYLFNNDAPELDHSNFGMAPERDVKESRLDSVIFIGDSVAVMVTSLYCTRRYYDDSKAKLWKAGKDTVFAHPLFSKQHALDSIKRELRKRYNFRNNIDSVKFINYDNDPESQPPSVAAVHGLNNNDNGSDSGLGLILFGGIALISGLTGFISWLFSKSPVVG